MRLNYNSDFSDFRFSGSRGAGIISVILHGVFYPESTGAIFGQKFEYDLQNFSRLYFV